MKKYKPQILLFLVLVAFGAYAAVTTAAPGPQRFIVVFDEAVNAPARNVLVERAGGVTLKNLNIINGKAVLLPDRAAANILSRKAGVVSVEPDQLARVSAKPAGGGKTPPAQPAEVLPWGVDRIDAELAWSGSTGAGVNVAVIDTGIDLDHPDLAANVKGNVNMTSSTKNGDDDNGHGSHVAGIIAGADNEIGVIGVAPQANLYAVKVLSRSGSGWVSDIIEGLDWAVIHDMDVANMSLGASVDVDAFRLAVANADAAGLIQVAAAGNESGPVGYPAAYPQVIAVSATTDVDLLAYYSNVGPEVDLAAPGSSIFSTYKGGGYATLSGTSMASPHVAGTAALVLAAKGPLTTAQLKARLAATADVLPGLSTSQQGAGLVDAEEASLAP